MVSAVDEELILQMLRRVKVFASRLVTVATTLKRKQNDQMRNYFLNNNPSNSLIKRRMITFIWKIGRNFEFRCWEGSLR
jgi:hypothetical protein